MHMIQRETYLNQLKAFQDQPLIKVITGMRRSGKSTLLKLFAEDLLSQGIHKDQLIQMNFEFMEFDQIRDYRALYTWIKDRMTGKSHVYLMLDEVQQVEHWEKAVNSLFMEGNADIYLTGSNASLLSSEISTLLSGRYIEIQVLPLSFQEYLQFLPAPKAENKDLAFQQYLKYGGLPIIPLLPQENDAIRLFLSGIYNTVLMKDIVQRNAVRDPALLDALVHFLAYNVGNPVSSPKISGYLTSVGRKTSTFTIDNYVRMLQSAFIFHKISRYDIKGKLHLKTQEKYYIADIGLRNALLGFRNTDYGHILENLVYLELLRRGYQVSIGKLGTLEIDFIAEKTDEKKYIQVSASIMDENTRRRELAPLEAISDNYEKFILTMDHTIFSDFNGIRCKNIIDFLLEKK